MKKISRFFALCAVATAFLPGCAAKQDASDPEVAAALPMLVIQKAQFDRDFHKFCTHTRDCASPLVCQSGKCEIPPAILGRETPETPRISVQTEKGKRDILVEIADDDYTMARGLMMRRSCQKGWGMLFVYENEGRRSFWMQNTYLALDMAFIRRDGSVSNVILHAEPLNNVPRYESTDRVQYVLELPAGSAEELSIRPGSKFDLSGIGK